MLESLMETSGSQPGATVSPRRLVATSEDIFGCHSLGADAAGIQEAESRDVCCFTSYKA